MTTRNNQSRSERPPFISASYKFPFDHIRPRTIACVPRSHLCGGRRLRRHRLRQPTNTGLSAIEGECIADMRRSQEIILMYILPQTMEELMEKSRMFERYIWVPNPWKPLVDGHFATRPFLPFPIKESFQKGKYHKVRKFTHQILHSCHASLLNIVSNHVIHLSKCKL